MTIGRKWLGVRCHMFIGSIRFLLFFDAMFSVERILVIHKSKGFSQELLAD